MEEELLQQMRMGRTLFAIPTSRVPPNSKMQVNINVEVNSNVDPLVFHFNTPKPLEVISRCVATLLTPPCVASSGLFNSGMQQAHEHVPAEGRAKLAAVSQHQRQH